MSRLHGTSLRIGRVTFRTILLILSLFVYTFEDIMKKSQVLGFFSKLHYKLVFGCNLTIPYILLGFYKYKNNTCCFLFFVFIIY